MIYCVMVRYSCCKSVYWCFCHTVFKVTVAHNRAMIDDKVIHAYEYTCQKRLNNQMTQTS